MRTGEVVKILPTSISRTKACELLLKVKGELNGDTTLVQNNFYNNLENKDVDLTPLIETKAKDMPIDVEYVELENIIS